MQSITIAHKGIKLSIGQYVALIRRVKASEPGTMYKETLNTWYPGTREEILQQFGQMVQDKITQHLPAVELTPRKLLRLQKAHLVSECKWCGSKLGEYKQAHERFCDASCNRSYWS